MGLRWVTVVCSSHVLIWFLTNRMRQTSIGFIKSHRKLAFILNSDYKNNLIGLFSWNG